LLGLSAIRHTTFGVNGAEPDYPGVVALFADRSAPYGVPVDRRQNLPGNRNSYAFMGAPVLRELAGAADPDLVVVAHALPDCGLATSISGYLEQRCTGQPLTFAVTEQGRATPFTAVRLVQQLATGGYHRVAVLAMDQGTIAYSDPALAGLDFGTDHVVGLLFTPGGAIKAGLARRLPGVSRERLTSVLAAELAELPSGPVTLVCGPTVPPPRTPHRLRVAPKDQLCTTVWAELAAELGTTTSFARTVLVVEYEPDLGYLCLCTFHVPANYGTRR